MYLICIEQPNWSERYLFQNKQNAIRFLKSDLIPDLYPGVENDAEELDGYAHRIINNDESGIWLEELEVMDGAVNSSRRGLRRLNSARTVYHPEWNTLEAGWEVTDIVSEILNIDQQTYVRYVIEETCLLYKPIANSEMSEFGYRFITSIDGKKHTVWIEANTDTGRSDICKQVAVEVARVITDTYKRAGELLP